MVIPVVLCGGVGKRLWPLSTPEFPKPFHSLVGNLSLLQNTLLRCVGEPFQSPIYVVTHAQHADIVRAQAMALGIEVFLILEQHSHDSCAAALAAAEIIARRDKHAKLAIVAADQHIPDHAAWRRAVAKASQANFPGFVLFGVTPDYPSTAYGYVEGTEPCASTGLRQAIQFIEKPNPDRAKAYVKAGWLWNSGNFFVKAEDLLLAAQTSVPAIASDIAQLVRKSHSSTDAITLHNSAVGDWAPLSLDKAILEFADNIAILPVDFVWSDVGTWDEVQRLNGNPAKFIHSQDIDVRVIGLDDIIVVATAQGILVTRKGHANDLKIATKQP